jgi:hypothetical protein
MDGFEKESVQVFILPNRYVIKSTDKFGNDTYQFSNTKTNAIDIASKINNVGFVLVDDISLFSCKCIEVQQKVVDCKVNNNYKQPYTLTIDKNNNKIK